MEFLIPSLKSAKNNPKLLYSLERQNNTLNDVLDDLRCAQGWDDKIHMINQNHGTLSPLQLNRVSLIQEYILLIGR